jgi:hypothetical protein
MEELIQMLKGVIEKNTAAMEKSAEASEKMASEVRGLRATIQGAQRKIAGELGPVIERGKKAADDLDAETRKIRAEQGGLGGEA